MQLVSELFFRRCFGKKQTASGGKLGELRVRELVERRNLDKLIRTRKNGTGPEARRYPFPAVLSFFNPARIGLTGSFRTSSRMNAASDSRGIPWFMVS